MPSDVDAHAKSGFSFLISWLIEWKIATRNRKCEKLLLLRAIPHPACEWQSSDVREAEKCSRLRPSRSRERVPCSASNLIKILRFWAENENEKRKLEMFLIHLRREASSPILMKRKVFGINWRQAGGRWRRRRLISARGLEQKPREIRLAFAEIWVTRRGMTIDLR